MTDHFCESYAYITREGDLLDICASDYFQGYPEDVAAQPCFNGLIIDGETLKNEVLEDIEG